MVKKLHIDDPQYQREKIALALSHAPTIYPCQKCGHPVAAGYCCGACGCTNPSGNKRYEDLAEELYDS